MRSPIPPLIDLAFLFAAVVLAAEVTRGETPETAPPGDAGAIPTIGGDPPSDSPRIDISPMLKIPEIRRPDRFRLPAARSGDPPLRDVLAGEIVRQQRLARGPVLVVWLFDETRSMQDDRETVRSRLERIREGLEPSTADLPPELVRLKPLVDRIAREHGPRAVSHVVAGFGQSFHLVRNEPTTDFARVLEAFDALPIDKSGVENTMHAVGAAIRVFSPADSVGRKVLIVLVTDESGDDGEAAEKVLQEAKARSVSVFVVGRQALFGRELIRLRARGRAGGATDNPVIRRGPESAAIEVFPWDGLHERPDEQPSGFAPYELGRLARDTWGLFLILPSEEAQRVEEREKLYSLRTLNPYGPEYVSRSEYEARRKGSKLRRTLWEAIVTARGFSLPLSFPRDAGPRARAVAKADRQAVALLEPLRTIERSLREIEPLSERESSSRWQAHYDLMLAQAVACQVTLLEYRACLATPAAAANAMEHSRNRHAPALVTDDRYAEAKRLLRLVIAKHSSTPWADLAQTILDRGLSVDWQAADSNASLSDGAGAGGDLRY